MREPKFNFTFGVNKNIMKTLISMTDFIMNVEIHNDYRADDFAVCYNYASFLKQPLKLEMFVPCNEGNVMPEPDKEYYRSTFDCVFHGYNWRDPYNEYCERYQKAKEKVLFKGFKVEDDLLIIPNFGKQEIKNIKGLTIEALTGFEIELTPTAIKQIGL